LKASVLLEVLLTTPKPPLTKHSVMNLCWLGLSLVVRPVGHCWQGLRLPLAE
jgi:hypothetical protein